MVDIVNYFESLGISSLTSTADLRRLSEHARVKQAMSKSAQLDASATTVERLLNDPLIRLREASLWYYGFRSTIEADDSDSDLNIHDETLLNFELLKRTVRQGGDPAEMLDEACLAAVEMLDDADATAPLIQLVSEIGDPRINPGMIPELLQTAVASWLSESLCLVARNAGPDVTRKASQRARESEFDDETDALICSRILATVASEVESALLEKGPEIRSLIELLETDASHDRELIRLTDNLIKVASPWDALVDIYDDDLDSGDEGRTLDGVANLVRSASVALANHTDNYIEARRLTAWAHEIAQSASLKAMTSGEFELLRFLAARRKFVLALQLNQYDDAVAVFAELQQAAVTPDQKEEAAQAASIVNNIRSRRVAAGSSGTGCGSIVGGLLAILVVVSLVTAVIWPGEDSPVSKGGGVAGLASSPNPVGFSGSGENIDAEGIAIEAERARLKRVEGDLIAMSEEIDSLSSDLDSLLLSYPNGAPSWVVDEYERKQRRDNQLFREYNTLSDEYERDIEEFNRRVDEYNSR